MNWIQGKGRIEIGDNVAIDGGCSLFFPMRYCEEPTLTVGDGTAIGYGCAFTVGRAVSIGKNCRIGSTVAFFDAPGHPIEPKARLAGAPSLDEDVKPIVIGNNVWIGSQAAIFPGVTIGDNSVVSFRAVVMHAVPANIVVAGNPARQVAKVPVSE